MAAISSEKCLPQAEFSASTVFAATGWKYQDGKIRPLTESKPPKPIAKKIVTGD